jgi:hypothetical protein
MWTPPMSNGGSPIVGYDIERRERSTAGRWAKITRSPIKVNDLMKLMHITLTLNYYNN